MVMPRMVDMAREEPETFSGIPLAIAQKMSKYPCGLSITLCDPELEKLGLSDDCQVGDMIHLFSMAEVTAISKNDNGDGERCQITLQLRFMSAEDEQAENAEVETEEMGGEKEKLTGKKKGRKNLYFE